MKERGTMLERDTGKEKHSYPTVTYTKDSMPMERETDRYPPTYITLSLIYIKGDIQV